MPRRSRMAIEPFTLVGATTRFGQLTPPMRARFGIVERLNFYGPEELARIVTRSAAILGPDGGGRRPEIARRSRGIAGGSPTGCSVGSATMPRSGRTGSSLAAGAALARPNVDEFGLDDMDARILSTIIEKFGGVARWAVQTPGAAVGEDSGTLEEIYEPYLLQQGPSRADAAGAGRHGGGVPPVRDRPACQSGHLFDDLHQRLRLPPS
ncbi:MAG: Holliday junction DNA helicase RuvB C-terminal domain-containing protein [Gemmatimonadales bacterium]